MRYTYIIAGNGTPAIYEVDSIKIKEVDDIDLKRITDFYEKRDRELQEFLGEIFNRSKRR